MKIDFKLAYLGLLRAVAEGARLAGQEERAVSVEKLIAAIESGQRVDAQMALVATAVASNADNDWAAVTARINEHGTEFQQPRDGG